MDAYNNYYYIKKHDEQIDFVRIVNVTAAQTTTQFTRPHGNVRNFPLIGACACKRIIILVDLYRLPWIIHFVYINVQTIFLKLRVVSTKNYCVLDKMRTIIQ